MNKKTLQEELTEQLLLILVIQEQMLRLAQIVAKQQERIVHLEQQKTSASVSYSHDPQQWAALMEEMKKGMM
jgi:hypothetical protein